MAQQFTGADAGNECTFTQRRQRRGTPQSFGGMNHTTWNEIVAALDSADADTCVEAASRLHRESEADDVPRLIELLADDSFFIREAAAWPLAELAGPSVLQELLAAYQRGFDEGHDNDGFTAALLEIPALHPTSTKPALHLIAESSLEPMQSHAVWLLEFCE